ncbi:MAG TPA: DNA-formamidopyrimidine glycosylase family protein, partial [Candidatus Babeliaceae bacterium]|nr:DNA-formamidopyrimidine glycosylase family protein [Candidatus Babeliaceae bacterium]
MPELPEIEAFKSYVTAHCLHKIITDIKVSDSSVLQRISPSNFKKMLIGHEFASVERLGKYLVIDVSNSDKKLVMHFGLTGSLFYTPNKNETVRFSRVQFIFKNAVLHWTCIRKFGKLWFVDDVQSVPGLHKLGPDALAISKKQFLALLSHNEKKNIKAFLMDQTNIAGIGNEYSDEALFQAGIDPHHTIKDLSEDVRQNLYTQLHKVLRYAIKIQVNNSKKPSGPQLLSKNDRETFPSSYLQAHRHIDMMC